MPKNKRKLKQKVKKQLLINHLEDDLKKKKKAKKVKQIGKAFGDFDNLLNLVSEDEKKLLKEKMKSSKPQDEVKAKFDKNRGRNKSIKRNKRRKKVMMEEINIFKQVMDHQEFRKDPVSAINKHLSNTIVD